MALAGLKSPPENGAIAIAIAPLIAPITMPFVSLKIRPFYALFKIYVVAVCVYNHRNSDHVNDHNCKELNKHRPKLLILLRGRDAERSNIQQFIMHLFGQLGFN